jgi:hypothetical protein
VGDTGLGLVPAAGLDDDGDAGRGGRSTTFDGRDLDAGSIGDGSVGALEGGWGGRAAAGEAGEEGHEGWRQGGDEEEVRRMEVNSTWRNVCPIRALGTDSSERRRDRRTNRGRR